MGNENIEVVGVLTQHVIDLLELDFEAGTLIYLGEQNIEHMKQRHLKEFQKYGRKIRKIIAEPDFIGLNEDESIEYVKSFGRFVKVAVRVSNTGLLFVRSLYHVSNSQVQQFLDAGRLISLTFDDLF